MTPKVGDVMMEVNNYFPKGNQETTWSIRQGRLTPCDGLMEGDWIAIGGSMHNNGVYCL